MASPSSPFRPLSQAPSAGKSSGGRRKASLPPSPLLLSPPVSPSRPLFRSSASSSNCAFSGGRRKASLPPSPPLLSPPVSPSRPLFRSSARSSAFISRQPRLLRGVAPDLGPASVFDHKVFQILDGETEMKSLIMEAQEALSESLFFKEDLQTHSNLLRMLFALPCGIISWISFVQVAQSSEGVRVDMVYEIGELFELGIQLSYLLTLLGLLGVGTFFVIRQVLVRRELDLSAKELQEQVRSGDAAATAYFELGAVMLRRKFYPAAIKYLQQAIEKWDGDDQDLAQVYNALGVSYTRDNKLDKGIAQFEKAVELQPGYTIAWNNLGDAYEKKKELRAALKAFEEVLLFDPNNKVARPRRDALRDRVQLYKGVTIKSKDQ